MLRGVYVLLEGLFYYFKCLVVVRICKGNFVYFVKCLVGFKGYLGILLYCC